MSEHLAIVKWLDASRSDDQAKAEGPIGIWRHSVGYLLRSDDAGVVLAMTKDHDPDGPRYEREFRIPRAYVKKIRRLK